MAFSTYTSESIDYSHVWKTRVGRSAAMYSNAAPRLIIMNISHQTYTRPTQRMIFFLGGGLSTARANVVSIVQSSNDLFSGHQIIHHAVELNSSKFFKILIVAHETRSHKLQAPAPKTSFPKQYIN